MSAFADTLPQTMRGVEVPALRSVRVARHPVPEPGPGQVLVRIRASGLCGSDLRAMYRGRGPEPYEGGIAGHEPCGEVAWVGPGVSSVAVGHRVAVYHIVGCGTCDECKRGWQIGCDGPGRVAYGWLRDGGHADFLLAEERSLVVLPENLTFVDGALSACGLGTAYQAVRRAEVVEGNTLLVVGLGPVGLGAAMLAAALGVRVVSVDPVPQRRELAARLELSAPVAPHEAAAAVADATQGVGVDASIDCSGSEDGRLTAMRDVRPWGRAVFVGEGGTLSFAPSLDLIHRQLTLVGSWVFGVNELRELLDLLSTRNVRADRMVTHSFDIDDAAEAYRVFDSGQTGKVVLTSGSE